VYRRQQWKSRAAACEDHQFVHKWVWLAEARMPLNRLGYRIRFCLHPLSLSNEKKPRPEGTRLFCARSVRPGAFQLIKYPSLA
jgi:hypothetical protein